MKGLHKNEKRHLSFYFDVDGSDEDMIAYKKIIVHTKKGYVN